MFSFKSQTNPCRCFDCRLLTTQQDRLHGMVNRWAYGKWFWGLMVALCRWAYRPH